MGAGANYPRRSSRGKECTQSAPSPSQALFPPSKMGEGWDGGQLELPAPLQTIICDSLDHAVGFTDRRGDRDFDAAVS